MAAKSASLCSIPVSLVLLLVVLCCSTLLPPVLSSADPEILSMHGCPGMDTRPRTQANCTAGSLLTVIGSGFTSDPSAIVGLAVYSAYVPIAVVSSTDTEVVFIVPQPLWDSVGNSWATYYIYIESACQAAGGAYEQYWYAADTNSSLSTTSDTVRHATNRHRNNSNSLETASVAYFPFPFVSSISGCSDVGNATRNCTGGTSIVISGSGFGCSNAIVFFSGSGSGYYCSDVHTVGSDSLRCTLPGVRGEYGGAFTLSVYTHNLWSNQVQLLWYGYPHNRTQNSTWPWDRQ